MGHKGMKGMGVRLEGSIGVDMEGCTKGTMSTVRRVSFTGICSMAANITCVKAFNANVESQ